MQQQSPVSAPQKQRTNNDNKQKRRRNNQRRVIVLLATVLVLFFVTWGTTSLLSKGVGGTPAATSSPASSTGSAPSSTPPVSSVPPAGSKLDPSAWNYIGPIKQEGDMQLITPDRRMIALPENGRVDIRYFDTVTFIGDSITQGLEIYKAAGLGSTQATFCAYKGISPKSIYDGSLCLRSDGVTREIPMDAIVASQPQNVYILMGANAMVNTKDDAIIEYYTEMLRQVRGNLDGAVKFYIQSITPVRPDNTSTFDQNRINGLNDRLARLAYDEGVYFLDLSEPLAAEDGYLREEFAARDGLHLSPAGYAAWVDYLVTHTAYDQRSVYLEGSPYFMPPEPAPPPAEEAPPAEESVPEEAPPEEVPA